MKLIVRLSVALFIGFICKTVKADVSHLKHSNEDRQYLPPLAEPHKHERHQKKPAVKLTLEQHDYKHEREYHQHVDNHVQKPEKPYKVSKPKGLPDPPLVHHHHLDTYTTRDDDTANEPLFAPAASDVYFQRQGEDHLIFANAPNSIFHTQINVQSQGSDFNAQNATPTQNISPAAAASPVAFNTAGNAATRRTQNVDIRQPGPNIAQRFNNGNFNAAETARVEQVVKPKTLTTTTTVSPRQRGSNYQHVNVISGNILGGIPTRSVDTTNVRNNQGTNIINGNFINSDREPTNMLNTANGNNFATAASNINAQRLHKQQAERVSHAIGRNPTALASVSKFEVANPNKNKFTHESEEQKRYEDDLYKKTNDFADIPDASSFEVIYKPGDDLGFTDTTAASFAYADDQNYAKQASEKQEDTDLREDGYHYNKPHVAFTY